MRYLKYCGAQGRKIDPSGYSVYKFDVAFFLIPKLKSISLVVQVLMASNISMKKNAGLKENNNDSLSQVWKVVER